MAASCIRSYIDKEKLAPGAKRFLNEKHSEIFNKLWNDKRIFNYKKGVWKKRSNPIGSTEALGEINQEYGTRVVAFSKVEGTNMEKVQINTLSLISEYDIEEPAPTRDINFYRGDRALMEQEQREEAMIDELVNNSEVIETTGVKNDFSDRENTPILNQKQAEKLLSYLSKKYGIEGTLEAMGMFNSYGQYDLAKNKIRINSETTLGRNGELTAALNPTGNISRRTIFHEYLHPFVNVLADQNKALYDELYNKAVEQNKKEQFADVSNYPKEEQKEELVVRYLDRLSDNDTSPTLFKRFLNWLSDLFFKNRKNSKADLAKLSKDTTVEDLYKIFENYGNLKEEASELNTRNKIVAELNLNKRLLEDFKGDPQIADNLRKEIKYLESLLTREDKVNYKLSLIQALERFINPIQGKKFRKYGERKQVERETLRLNPKEIIDEYGNKWNEVNIGGQTTDIIPENYGNKITNCTL